MHQFILVNIEVWNWSAVSAVTYDRPTINVSFSSLNVTVSRMDATLAIMNESKYLLKAQVPRVNTTVSSLSEMDDTTQGTPNNCVIFHTSNVAQFLTPIFLILLTAQHSNCMNT